MYLDGVMNWVNCLRRGTKDEVRSNVDPGCVDYKRVGGDAWSDNLPNWLFWALATNKLRPHIYAYMKKLQSIEEERATRNGVSNLIESPHTKSVHNPTENVVQDRPWLKQDVTFVKVQVPNNFRSTLCWSQIAIACLVASSSVWVTVTQLPVGRSYISTE